MIKAFRDTETELLWTDEFSRRIAADIHKAALVEITDYH